VQILHDSVQPESPSGLLRIRTILADRRCRALTGIITAFAKDKSTLRASGYPVSSNCYEPDEAGVGYNVVPPAALLCKDIPVPVSCDYLK